jgi:hypothetical protein
MDGKSSLTSATQDVISSELLVSIDHLCITVKDWLMVAMCLSQNLQKERRGLGSLAQVVEHLPIKCKANPNTAKKLQKKSRMFESLYVCVNFNLLDFKISTFKWKQPAQYQSQNFQTK